ncbi:MAG: rod shape-determining protein MreC [Rhodospirillales bacterium]|nr:MAG: rod shape-determining protein MreC [Rhodospirillales bacterium]
MNERLRHEPRTFGVIRALLQRFAYLGMVLAAVALMMVGKADALLMERMRIVMADAVAPILNVLTRPADAIAGGVESVRRWIELHEENARLREERDRLLQWQAVALRLEAENDSLRRLSHLVPAPVAVERSARVIGDSGGTFAQSLLLFAGKTHGIGHGDAVLTGEGLVGRIVGVSDRSARALLVTDLNSRIPVVVANADRPRAVLAGDNSDRPRLIHHVPGVTVNVGDRVVTSGDAGAFPPGLPIGIVAEVADGEIRVQPFAERGRLDHVRVVDFGLGGILGERFAGPGGGSAGGRSQLAETAPVAP